MVEGVLVQFGGLVEHLGDGGEALGFVGREEGRVGERFMDEGDLPGEVHLWLVGDGCGFVNQGVGLRG